MATGPRPLVLPRFGTPRDESRNTWGPQVGEVAARLGTPFMPHQQYVMDVALEFDEHGRFIYREVDISIMRQSGKTLMVFAKMVWRLVMAIHLWGAQRTLYTAQSGKKARDKLERDFADILRNTANFKEIENPKARPKSPVQWKLSLNNGHENIQFGRGNYLIIEAPTKKAAHGDTLDDINIDEAFAHADDSIEQGASPAQATRWNAQKWIYSTAGDETSFYWWPKVEAGRAEIETGRRALAAGRPWPRSSTAFFDWSLPDDADIDDEDVWWEYMPALGHLIEPEFLRAELESARRKPAEEGGGEGLWRRGYGNQWVRRPPGKAEAIPPKIPQDRWLATGLPTRAAKARARSFGRGEITVGWAATKDCDKVAVAVAGGSQADPYVELYKLQPGAGWVADVIAGIVRELDPAAFGCRPLSPAGALVAGVLAAVAKVRPKSTDKYQMVNTAEYRSACTALYLDVKETIDETGRARLARPLEGQGPLDTAVADAIEEKSGTDWVWTSRHDGGDVIALEAVTIARSLLPVKRSRRPLVATTS